MNGGEEFPFRFSKNVQIRWCEQCANFFEPELKENMAVSV